MVEAGCHPSQFLNLTALLFGVPTAFYSPAPFPIGEEQRQTIVDRLLSLDLDPAELNRLTGMAADLFAVPMAAVTVLDWDRQWLAAKTGLSVSTTSRSASFCGHTIHQKIPLCIEDARADLRFAGNPLVVRSPSIRFANAAGPGRMSREVTASAKGGQRCAAGRLHAAPAATTSVIFTLAQNVPFLTGGNSAALVSAGRHRSAQGQSEPPRYFAETKIAKHVRSTDHARDR